MPSEYGPYTVLALLGEFFVQNKEAYFVLDFTNGKPNLLAFTTNALASAAAGSLSTDDTQYRALVKAHYLGGIVTVSQNGITEIMSVIAALEVASFAADPVAVASIARLLAVVVAL